MDHGRINDLDIQALVDNQLGWEDEKRVRSRIEQDPKARDRFEMLKQQKMLIRDWWQAKKSH